MPGSVPIVVDFLFMSAVPAAVLLGQRISLKKAVPSVAIRLLLLMGRARDREKGGGPLSVLIPSALKAQSPFPGGFTD